MGYIHHFLIMLEALVIDTHKGCRCVCVISPLPSEPPFLGATEAMLSDSQHS